MWEILRVIAREAMSLELKVYLVGGALRDLLLGIPPKDLDIVVSKGALGLAAAFAEKYQGRLIVLDRQRETVRVVIKDNYPVDFCLLNGGTIDSDLGSRDFTVNALGVELNSLFTSNSNIAACSSLSELNRHIIDPTGGLMDLKHCLLRVAGINSMQEDPLRVLRGVRLAARFNLHILPETTVFMRSGCRKIDLVAGERIWQELASILAFPDTYKWVDYLDREIKIWPSLLPGRLRMEETTQNYYHSENVWLHSLRTLSSLESILIGLPSDTKYSHRFLEHYNTTLGGGHSRLQLLKLAALMHDVGKPDTARTHDGGVISFHGHPEAGLPYVEALSQRLKLSCPERHYLMELVRLHMEPLHHYTLKDHSELALYRLYRKLGDNALDILLLSLADLTATYIAGERLSELSAYKRFNLRLITDFLLRHDYFNPPRMLSGDDLVHLGVPKGPMIGHFLELLSEAQIDGQVVDSNSARTWVRAKLLETVQDDK